MNSKKPIIKSLRTKMILAFCLPTILLIIVNLTLYVGTSNMMEILDDVYSTNTRLTELNATLDNVQGAMEAYLNSRTSDTLEQYYTYEQDYYNQIAELNGENLDSQFMVMERNIYNLSTQYLTMTNQAVEYKRGGNVEKYKSEYQEASQAYRYISDYIYSLNNQQFENNSQSYTAMIAAMQSMEQINLFTLFVIGIGNLLFVVLIASTITRPLRGLSHAANQVSAGDFELELLPEESKDEIGVVTHAFNKMVVSIREYIARLTQSMETERQLRENELMMETNLKDAQLKYLQAQINPHFLFNTLNAGVQLAMMEGAERTSTYIERVADFFRYNIKKDHDVVTLAEEIELVETYVYILNV